MPTTKKQFDRINLLTSLLRQHHTKRELIEIYKDNGFAIHPKTLNNDISYLKDQGAEIHIPNRADSFYYFTEQFVPENSHFTEEDVEILQQCIQILSNSFGFHVVNDLKEILLKSKFLKYELTNNQKQIVSFENQIIASGSEFLDDIYVAIKNQECLKINFTPNSTQQASDYIISPYYLKEYRNRWYLLGLKNENNFLMNIPLDRINSIKPEYKLKYIKTDKDFELLYEYVVGVTIPMESDSQTIQLKINKSSANYVLSKPFITNQELISVNEDGSINIQFKAYINYELKQNILGYGSAIEVLEPLHLRQELFKIYSEAMNQNRVVNL